MNIASFKHPDCLSPHSADATRQPLTGMSALLRILVCCALLSTLIMSTAVLAQSHVSASSLLWAGVEVQGLEASLDPAPSARLRVAVERLSVDGAPDIPGPLAMDCLLTSADAGSATHCRGQLSVAGRVFAMLWVETATQQQLEISEAGKGRVRISFIDAERPLGILLDAVDTEWLLGLPLLSGLLDMPLSGRVSGQLQMVFPAHIPWALSGTVQFSQLSAELADGSVISAGLGFGGDLAVTPSGEGFGASLSLRVNEGELLAGPLYLDFAQGPLRLSLVAGWDGADTVAISEFDLLDDERLQAEGALVFSMAEQGGLQSLQVSEVAATLPGALDRYAADLFAAAGFSGLASEGSVKGSLRYADGQIAHLQLRLDDVWLDDPEGRISIAGLQGSFGLGTGEGPRQHQLAWQGLSLLGLPIAAGSLQLEQLGRGFRLLEASQFEMLGGQLSLDRFLWRPATGTGSDSFAMGVSAYELSMIELSQVLGWPQMGGSITGSLPNVQYADGVLTSEGGLSVALFDGELRIENLQLERPFGVLPTLAADIRARELDLTLLTGTFEFGAIEGRLDADVSGLRLLNWEPVAFDSFLRTSLTAEGRRRVSQRAVNNLSSLGGAPGMAVLSQTALRFFETFRYEQIGLRCVLRNNICQMDGLEPADNGYYIVKGSGLPRLNVIGFQRRVDWPVLLARLAQATSGGGVRVGSESE